MLSKVVLPQSCYHPFGISLFDPPPAAGLLLSGATAQNKRAFNILCEQPETVAAYLVPRIRTVVARGDRRRYIRYLTPTRVLWFFLMAPLRMRRFFDGDGVHRHLLSCSRDPIRLAALCCSVASLPVCLE